MKLVLTYYIAKHISGLILLKWIAAPFTLQREEYVFMILGKIFPLWKSTSRKIGRYCTFVSPSLFFYWWFWDEISCRLINIHKKFGSENQQQSSYWPLKIFKILIKQHKETRVEHHHPVTVLTQDILSKTAWSDTRATVMVANNNNDENQFKEI